VTRKADTNLNRRLACQFRVTRHNRLTFSSANHEIVTGIDPHLCGFIYRLEEKVPSPEEGVLAADVAVLLDTAQKGSYDLGLPLPGPARL
jgi:hypothetical protein